MPQRGAQALFHHRVVERAVEHLLHGVAALHRPGQQVRQGARPPGRSSRHPAGARCHARRTHARRRGSSASRGCGPGRRNRPDRGQAGHHPRRGGDAAAAAAGGEGRGQGADPHRASRRGGRSSVAGDGFTNRHHSGRARAGEGHLRERADRRVRGQARHRRGRAPRFSTPRWRWNRRSTRSPSARRIASRGSRRSPRSARRSTGAADPRG